MTILPVSTSTTSEKLRMILLVVSIEVVSSPGEKEDIIGAVKFLLSEESSYITGTSINIDGGWLSKGL